MSSLEDTEPDATVTPAVSGSPAAGLVQAKPPRWVGLRFSSHVRVDEGEAGLATLCDYLAGYLRTGDFESVEIRLYGTGEATFVRNYMAAHHPKVQYTLV